MTRSPSRSRTLSTLLAQQAMTAFYGATWLLARIAPPQLVVRMASRQMNTPEIKRQPFAGYRPGPQDVFVCTYSKSGTNWAMQMVVQIAHHGRAEYEKIHDLVPWPEAPFPGIARLDDAGTYRSAPTGLRAVKTHLESDYVPYSPQAKYIVVVRDPKDVLVSSYHFSSKVLPLPQMLPVAEWVELFLTGPFQYGSWAEHLAGFWAWRNRPNVLLLTYGEMKADLSGTVRRVAELMGVGLAEQEHAAVVERCGFEYMQRIDHKFLPPMPGERGLRRKPVMMRRGSAGGSGELLTPAQQALIDRHLRADLRRRGCDAPYDELFAQKSKK
ncbi:MAG TPA: sulfotransferase domain-containing protein [Roseiflexaceae bacterium]|nr:sulfotransferase domain-containing protein [Roseiflexaceae bacterium]